MYFAGTDSMGEFQTLWQSTDATEIEYFNKINELHRQSMYLPVFNSTPFVLEVEDLRGLTASLGVGLTEWDCSNQQLVAREDYDLSRYELVVIRNQNYIMEEFADTINQYVSNGGNIIVAGSTGNTGNNQTDQPRMTRLPHEPSLIQYNTVSDSYAEITMPNALDVSVSSFARDWTGIRIPPTANLTGDYIAVKTGLAMEDQLYYPIVLYQNSSQPGSGYVLYFGAHTDYGTEDRDPDRRVFEKFVEKKLGRDDLIAADGMLDTIITCAIHPDGEEAMIGAVNGDSSGVLSAKFNIADRGITINDPWIYTGTENLYWNGWADQAENVISLSTTLLSREARNHVFRDSYHDPIFEVCAVPFHEDIIPSEVVSIRVDFKNRYEYRNASETEATIELPANVELISPSATISIGLIDGASVTRATWLVSANTNGSYDFNVTLKNYDTPIANARVHMYVEKGRLTMQLLPDVVILPGDTFAIGCTVTYEGIGNSGDLSFAWIFEDLIWGNPGSVSSQDPLDNGEQRLITRTPSELPYQEPGDIGSAWFRVFSNEDTHAWVEGYSEVHVVETLLDVTLNKDFDSYMAGESANITAVVMANGTAPLSDVEISLELPQGSTLLSGEQERWIGYLAPTANISFEWEVLLPQGAQEVGIESSTHAEIMIADPVPVIVFSQPVVSHDQAMVANETTFFASFEEDPGEVTLYYRGPDETGWQSMLMVDTPESSNNTYVADLAPFDTAGEGFFYVVWERFSTPTERFLVESSLSDPPQDVVATAYGGMVNLTWNAPANNGGTSVSQYRLYRADTSVTPSIYVLVGAVLNRSFEDESVINGRTYSYVITAVTEAGESALSAAVVATPKGPPSPTGKIATTANSSPIQVTLNWTAPSNNRGATKAGNPM